MSDSHFDKEKILRIFISSPSDVRPERIIAERVIARLNREFSHYFRVEPILWEREPLLASHHFQEKITPPHLTDIVVVILWSRLGYPLPENKFPGPITGKSVTGTEWEFEDALKAQRELNLPDVLMYRKKAPVTAVLDDDAMLDEMRQQKRLVDRFIETWFMDSSAQSFSAAFREFEDDHLFEEMLEEHLRELLKKKIDRLDSVDGHLDHQVRWHRGSPFRGLLSFELEYAPVFFGRVRAKNELRQLLVKQINGGSAFVMVVGASGSGKSSLVKAGLLADLVIPGMVGNVALTRYAIFTPSSKPGDLLEVLAQAIVDQGALPELAQDLGLELNNLVNLMRAAPDQIIWVIKKALAIAAEKGKLTAIGQARLVVVVDQFEEIFTKEGVTQTQREIFVEVLEVLAKSSLVWVVATMRSDFFEHLEKLPKLVHLSAGARYLVVPTEVAEIAQIIRQPAREAGLKFEYDAELGLSLDEVIQQAASKDTAALPLLSFVLDQLWQKRNDAGVLSFEAYHQLGGLEGALGNKAEQVFLEQLPEVQAELHSILRELVTVGADGKITSRWAWIDTLFANPHRQTLVEAFLHPEARLLVIDSSGSQARVRVSHEALLSHWDRAKQIVEKEKRDIELRGRLELGALRWSQAQSKDKISLLLSKGQPLQEALDLQNRWPDQLDPFLKQFIEASRSESQKNTRRKIQLVVGSTLAMPLTVLIFWAVMVFSGVREIEKQLEFVSIPEGCYQMGSYDTDKDQYPHEKPVHEVCIKAFAMGKYHITRGQWSKVMIHNSDPSTFKNDERLPIETISWSEAKNFIQLMNIFGAYKYRFATESEYEYIARAGTKTVRYWGDHIDDACVYENISSLERKIDNRDAVVANCKDGYVNTSPVGSFKPNPFGLYDVHGNVWSYVEDCWHASYVGAPTDGSAWTTGDCSGRVIRGGSWNGTPGIIRAADRYYAVKGFRGGDIGFRIVRDSK